MVRSRLNRHEEKNAQKRLFGALFGMVLLIAFVGFFGFKILVGFSLMIDKFRGNSPVVEQQSIILAPSLDSLPTATFSATLTINGQGEAGLMASLYKNDTHYKDIDISENGTFSIEGVAVDEGQNSFYVTQTDDKGNTSDHSNTINTTIDNKPPKLDISKPSDNTSINDGTHRVPVEGVTESDARVHINGRIVVLKSDGTFTTNMTLVDGDNTLSIIATDLAGNKTEVKRIVKYIP